MRVLPILFNTEMVRAILDGRKTCTRRLPSKRIQEAYFSYEIWANAVAGPRCKKLSEKEFYEQYPPYQPGDILYVRESVWQMKGHSLAISGETEAIWWSEFKYPATDETPKDGWDYVWVKRPSIHMPKEAARIWLKVTGVRLERLQDMDWRDALAEGVNTQFSRDKTGEYIFDVNPLDDFADLWNNTVKKADLDYSGWDASPWVWAVEYERCEKSVGPWD